ncbi:hypothetical protein Ddye_003142 [Dipteronia dyeriana]|uniref:Uncharacterized protein n=1 Tax=Dipteronia dyeriana TaxID=168575 RepID=A0AAD9XT11_9ROSI|nr:hypothetical protein Ddye_003142 [Dipteronia dyeriana]
MMLEIMMKVLLEFLIATLLSPNKMLKDARFQLLEQSGVVEAPGLCYRSIPAVVTTAFGKMVISKGRQGRESQNIPRVYLANLRLKEVGIDVLVTAYEPISIDFLSTLLYGEWDRKDLLGISQVGWPMLQLLHLFKQLQLLLLHRPYLFHKIKVSI